MNMENLKLIIAQNLTELRKRKKYTQQDLAEMLQYSDKAISKWEKGDSLPDIETLYQICEIFGVTLDFLTHEGSFEEKKEFLKEDAQTKNKVVIALLFESAVWLIAIVLYTFCVLTLNINFWICLAWGVPATAAVGLFFNYIWGKKKYVLPLNTFLIWSAITAAYFQVVYATNLFTMWPLFLLGIPLQAAAILWSQLKR